MKKILFFSSLLLLSATSFSQTNKRLAFQKYKEAKNLYYEENYTKSVELFKESISELGDTNVRIQNLFVKALSKIKDWELLEKELQKYIELQKKHNRDKDPEIEDIKIALKTYSLKEQGDYLSAKNLNSIKYFEKFLLEYPKSKYTNQVKEMLFNAKDEEAWARYVNISTLKYLNLYILNFKNGKNINEAQEIFNKMDDVARKEAIDQNTQNSYQTYLDTFENGKYRKEIELEYNDKRDDDLFTSATNVNTVGAFESYLYNSPKGKYIAKANKEIEIIMYNEVKASDKPYSYFALKRKAQEFKEKFPNSMRLKEVDKLYKKSLRQVKRKNSGMLFLTYETNKSYGIQLGNLRARNIGWYMSIRGNENVIDASFTNKDVVSEITFNSLSDTKIMYGSASLGLTYPIVYPLYLSAGAGVNFKQYSNEDATVIFSLEEEKKYAIFPELGLQAKLGTLIIGGGASCIREEIIYKMGIGFTF